MKRDKIINKILAVFFTILSLAWIYPMVMILMNSFKEETTITTSTAFDFVTSEARFLSSLWIFSSNYHHICSTDLGLLLNVCMVYCSCKKSH